MATVEVESSPVQPAELSFVSTVCLPFLLAGQNDDGGWGFRPGSQSRVEATSWALLALQGQGSPNNVLQEGFRFLREAQLPDGSWPSSATQEVGCWVTSLAAWALLASPESSAALSAGLRWICEDRPRDSSFVRRLMRRIALPDKNSQNDLLRGWGWTPRTASWVEPTALATIVLGQATHELLPNKSKRRRELAKLLIYDRMCPGGGWNCGNPMVYGVPGDPLVEPTVWALLALRDESGNEKKTLSLQWLEGSLGRTVGPGSLALSKICLKAYERPWPPHAPSIMKLYERNAFLGSVPVMAWVCLAMGERPGWLKMSGPGGP